MHALHLVRSGLADPGPAPRKNPGRPDSSARSPERLTTRDFVLSLFPVRTENSVRAENAGFTIIREVVVVSNDELASGCFFFAVIASSFRTRPASEDSCPSLPTCRSPSERAPSCASGPGAGCCGFRCHDSDPVGADVCESFSPRRSCVAARSRLDLSSPISQLLLPISRGLSLDRLYPLGRWSFRQ